jgi:hypothetical protein
MAFLGHSFLTLLIWGKRTTGSIAGRKRTRCQIAGYSCGTVIRRFGRAFSSWRTCRLKRSASCFITISS